MKKISGLLVACLVQGAAFASTFEQKTFFLPHNPVRTTLLEQALFRTHRHSAALDQDGHIQATAFYGESTNRAGLGRYFGIGNGKNSFKVGAELTPPPAVVDRATELDGGFLIHDRAHAQNSTLAGKLTLMPKQTVYGAQLTYRQSFEGPFKGVFFQANAPFVQVKNDLGMTVENETKVTLGTAQFGVADFFAGKVVGTGENAQTGLTAGKMVAGPRYATGVADLNLQLGYKLVCNADRHVDVAVRGVVPTGNKSKAEFLFEPLVGNNGHFGLGFGVEADMTLWSDPRGRLAMQGSAAYDYLFENTERRLAGITRRTEDTFKFNHYALVGKPGAVTVAPAANALAQDFKVRPGSQLELMTGFSFHSSGGVSVNVGYNLNWKEAERVARKATTVFFDDYAVVAKAATLNARIPVAAAGVGDFVGVQSRSGVVPVGSRVSTHFDNALLNDTAANGPGAVLDDAVHLAGLVVADIAGSGANHGVDTILAIAPPHVDQANRVVAYQAASRLYAATGVDILANTAAAGAGAAGRAAAVGDATAARNLVQNLQRAEVSYADSVRQEALITHVLGASIGYSFEIQKGFPLMVGVGGQYELPHSSNAGLESYKLFGKLGLSF